MKLKSASVGLLVIIVMFGGILAAGGLNLWQTTSSKVPATFKTGEWAGQYDPQDIRGSYTFADVAKYFALPVDVLADGFGVSRNEAADFQIKNLESMYEALKEQGMEVGTSSVRLFVAWYRGLPFTDTELPWLPQPAAELLRKQASLSSTQLHHLETHSVDLQEETEAPAGGDIHTAVGESIKGKTTFRELLGWGLSQDAIEEALGRKMPPTQTVIRDFCTQNELTFSTVKAELQKKIDAIGK